MNDREFIELLNLYVDHEISAEDALRLEKEVAADPERREVYRQYCRMQKACSMLSEELLESAAKQTSPSVAAFPRQSKWGYGSLVAGLAAACAVGLLALRYEGGGPASAPVAAAAPHASPSAAPARFADAQVQMKPVFFVRLSPAQSPQVRERALFTASDEPVRVDGLNWIGDIHMAPVYSNANSDFLLNPKTDLRSSAITETPDDRESQQPAELAAFRFQR